GEEREPPGPRVAPAHVRRDTRDGRPVGRVARRFVAPGAVARERRDAAAPDIDLGERRGIHRALALRRIMHEGDAPAVRRDVEVRCARLGPRQLAAGALEEVDDPPARQLERQEMRHASHREVAVEMPVLRLRGDVRAFLALAERLVHALLRGTALRVRPYPRDEHDALAVGHPAEVLDARAEVALALRLAAGRGDHVELRFAVLVPLLLALREEGDAIAARR